MSKYRILVVDDDPLQRETLQTYLELADYEVVVASNGVEALEFLKTNRAPDLVLMDVEMPEMDGFTATKKMQATPELKKIPVVFLTAVARPHFKVKGLQLGAVDYITKPFDRAELLARVKARLRSAEQTCAPKGDLVGTLGTMALDSLLQSVCTSGRSGTITLSSVDGEIRFKDNHLLSIRIGKHEGVEALARLMLAGDVPFSVQFETLEDQPTDQPVSVQQVLMDAAVTIDELERQLEVLGGDDPLVVIDRNTDEFPELRRLYPLSPLHLHDLLIRMNGKLSVSATTIAEAYRRNKLTVAAQDE